MFSRTVPLKRKFSCSTTPIWRRSQKGSVWLQIDAIDQDPAGLRDVEPLQELREGTFARAAAPDYSYRRALRNLTREVAQNLRTIELVAEADVLEPHGAAGSPADSSCWGSKPAPPGC